VEDESTPAPGADAFRWFFYAASPPWSNTRHSLTNVRLLQKDFQVKLRNVYSFFTIYANIDGWRATEPSHAGRPRSERGLLDRWMLSELHLAVRDVRRALDEYMVYDAAQRLINLADGTSNWYVRRSRERFWAPGLAEDKCDAYATLYEALVTIARLVAPFLPFFAEEMFQNLVVRAGAPGAAESVHLDAYPEPEPAAVDERLSAEMTAVRDIVSLGLSVRTANKLKVRQPLSRADVVFNDATLMRRLEQHRELITDELNVHEVRFMHPGHEQGAVSFRLKPNFRALGPRLGKGVQDVKKALEAADGAALHAELTQQGRITLQALGQILELSPEEVDVAVEAAPGFAAETGRVGVVVMHTTLSEELIDEGILRELLSRIQATRKDLGLAFTDRVELLIDGSERLIRVAKAGSEQITRECLASSVHFGERGADPKEHQLGDESVLLSVRKVST
jgi:isoleucyl-tRNA synthetase